MDQIYSLVKLFGERYIFCDDDQAMIDCRISREDMVSSFTAIMDFIKMKRSEDDDRH